LEEGPDAPAQRAQPVNAVAAATQERTEWAGWRGNAIETSPAQAVTFVDLGLLAAASEGCVAHQPQPCVLR
jgi:hypothetical protein